MPRLRAYVLGCLAASVTAQGDRTVAAHMQAFAERIEQLERAIDRGERANYSGSLDAIRATAKSLRTAIGKTRTPAAAHWLDALELAATDLGNAAGSAATERYDFEQLRRACTSCHLQTRSDNTERGLYPTRGNALYGTIELLDRGGQPRDDRSGAVVFLEGAIAKSPPLPRKPLILQKGRRFHPSVLVVSTGTTVRFPNNDVVFHNVFSRSRRNAFDLGTYGKGIEKEVVLANAGLVKVHCNIHPQMTASVLVLENTYAAVTSASGFWAIPDVPDGEYRVRVWHPLAKVEPRTVRCNGDDAIAVEIRVREAKARIQHTNKHGRKYRAKY